MRWVGAWKHLTVMGFPGCDLFACSSIPFYSHRLAPGAGWAETRIEELNLSWEPGRGSSSAARPGWRRCSVAASLGNEVSPPELPAGISQQRRPARRDPERPTRARCAAPRGVRDQNPGSQAWWQAPLSLYWLAICLNPSSFVYFFVLFLFLVDEYRT